MWNVAWVVGGQIIRSAISEANYRRIRMDCTSDLSLYCQVFHMMVKLSGQERRTSSMPVSGCSGETGIGNCFDKKQVIELEENWKL